MVLRSRYGWLSSVDRRLLCVRTNVVTPLLRAGLWRIISPFWKMSSMISRMSSVKAGGAFSSQWKIGQSDPPMRSEGC